jgi:Domain of unknown function (DUF4279)
VNEYISISLAICSDHTEPDAITVRVGLQPTGTRKRGTPTRNGLLRRPEFDLHEWWIREELALPSGVLSVEEFEVFVTEFFHQFAHNGAEAIIHALSADHDVLVLLVYQMNYVPYVGLTKRHVQALARLGARLDCDLMVDEPPIEDRA